MTFNPTIILPQSVPSNKFSDVPEPGIPVGTPWYLHPTFFEVIAIAFLVFFLILWW